VELAFQRYATSKITGLADLENITSLGFRGEALPSIAAVARVEILTRSKEAPAGTYLSLHSGKVVTKGTKACPQGTTITVQGLFRNVPARLKFLKSLPTENSHIAELVSQYSLAFPGVRFTLIIDGRRVLQTPGSGKLRDALVEVYGLEVAQAMLEVGASNKGGLAPHVSGYIGTPSISRTNRSYLSFFVNQRWVKSLLLARAVEKAYEGLLMAGRYPIAVINLSLSPQNIDVNIHPTKREVRFLPEPIIFHTVYEVVRRTLVEQMPVPEIKSLPPSTPIPEQTLMSPIEVIKKPSSALPLIPRAAPSGLPFLRVLGQLANTYIIAEGPDGLYLIDQHAAHERVLFEKILAQQAQGAVEIQALLEPLTVELSARQEELLQAKREMLAQFGFTIEPFGGRTYLVRAVPAMLTGQAIEEMLKETLDSPENEATPTKGEEKVAISLACHSAVRAGQTIDPEEMRELVKQLERTNSPHTCPHGRPTMVHLSSGRLEKEFGRG